MELSHLLAQGVAELGLELSAEQHGKLLAYVELLQKWNRTFNLTAIRDPREMVTQHLLDSLAVLSVLQKSALAGRLWADIGSGAGLPGIPLAIAAPELGMTLVETVAKKSAFQRQAKIELSLSNLTVVNARVERIAGGSFDGVISRAFAELADFAKLAGHLPTAQGALYAMKGALSPEELQHLPPHWAVKSSAALHVPGLNAQRHLVILERT